ncbi:hypothetical protein G7K_5770-t1 [Saitoella complicata NRRL Y-17804]|uniref:Uncharacterized protein n=1 Tax=Saitoella complicata (strain BCRC 22490 / CBS 7301 / JCM 7358 / NBRC 10748 / NRRL Y-17804) TaxID=698492 RepID=A0A0E9NP70_SAICN|nr:hypothetical protein G7K_5770-t1 [Saitoella complicata NRRL Y-17804]
MTILGIFSRSLAAGSTPSSLPVAEYAGTTSQIFPEFGRVSTVHSPAELHAVTNGTFPLVDNTWYPTRG